MKLMAVRRVQMAQQGKSDVPLPPAPPPHPGYAPNAALHAIKRHALEFVNPKAVAVSFNEEISYTFGSYLFHDFFCSIFRWETKRKVLLPKVYVLHQVSF